MQSEPEVISVYADGGVIGSNPSRIGGTYAFAYVGSDGKRFREHAGVLKPSEGLNGVVTNNVTELYALASAVWEIQHMGGWGGKHFHIYSDSNVSLLRVFRAAKLNNVPDYLAELVGKVRGLLRYLDFEYTLLDGHPTRAQLAAGIGKRGSPVSEHNVYVDRLCGEQATKYRLELASMEAAA